MQHIEEHILELYVLNSDKVSSHRAEIEAHLRVCHGCRDLVEQMKESYRSVEQRFNRLGTDSAMSSRTLVRSRTGLETSSKRDAPQIVSYRPVRRVQQLTYFIRRHPVAVGSSSFMTLAGLALLGNLLFKTPAITDKNPAHVHYNPGSNQVEVLNKVNQSLWQMPSRDLQAMEKGEMEARTTRTTVADINGDGANEVLTTLWTFADSVSGPSALKVYDTNGDLQFLFQFKGQIRYLNRIYPSIWGADQLLVGDPDASGQRQILAGWGSGRSPWVMSRFDSKGNMLGEFWHFGVIQGMALTDVNRDGREQVILMGENDVLDSVGGEFPTIVVLDPEKIVGASKSVGSPGFGLPFSEAELYYIRLPVSPLSSAILKHELVARLTYADNDRIAFWVINNAEMPGPEYADLEYMFSRDFKVLQVKSTSVTEALYKRLVQQGRLTGSLDKKYLENLRDGIRYWDGEDWVREAVKVKHRPPIAERQ